MREQRFLSITLLLVAMLGVPALYSTMREPRAKTEVSLEEGRLLSARTPASIMTEGAVLPVRNSVKSKPLTLNYSCSDFEEDQEVDANLLRLRGPSCIQEMSITNQTNGFTASIISLKENGFTTDFIDLSPGENTLEIKGINSEGKVVQQFLKVHSRSPASERPMPSPLEIFDSEEN
ncbi:MAG: hypothetical protein COT73_04625 [Bdellovibrio sp. CG10_big_fil_rev_8_21_14_0_10_47_8]|nr:MAG: hypothetical protein COT73_04625 [Bdellovibrio sp. CG10_big_fil_rev_8_21_14_0_10_47_8]